MTAQEKKKIVVLTDGKRGHENQSLALAEALSRRTRCSVLLCPVGRALPYRPDLLLAAGHRTHGRLFWLGQRYRCPTVVIMKPSLPAPFFSLVLAPSHDYERQSPPPNVVLTEGPLCRLPEQPLDKLSQGLILFGGASKHYAWEAAPLLTQLERILSQSALRWKISDSRRTPDSTRRHLQSYFRQYVPHEQTDPKWLPNELGRSTSVWVTRDSLSMLYEALTAGACVGVFDLPLRSSPTRVTRTVERLIADGTICSFSQAEECLVKKEGSLPPSFHEAARSAEEILARGLL